MKSFFNYAKNRILYNIFRFLFFLLIAFLLVTYKVNALETNFEYIEVKGYNNNGNSLSSPNQFNCSVGSCGMEITTVANSYGGAWIIQSPIPILSNHNYALSLRIRSSSYEITLSSKYQVAVGEDLFKAKANYETSNFKNNLKSYKFAGNSTLQYYFQSNINASYIVVPFTTGVTTTASFMIDTIVIEDLGTESLTEQEITNITNNQTNIIQNQLNDLNDNINNSIEDSFSVCTGSTNNLLSSDNWSKGYINGNGTVSSSNTDLLSGYIRVNNNNTYTISTNTEFINIGYALFDSSYNFISRLDNNNSSNVTIKTTSNSYYIRIWFNPNNDSSITYDKLINNFNTVFSNSICSNRLDNLNDTQKETNNKLDEANNTSKGIWDTLKSLPETIINGFLDLLISVFVPEDDFFSNWFDEVKSMFEEQLGFLATPFTIIIEFIERFLDLNSSTDIIIDIPDIKVPNFENITLIEATSFNWSSLLNSKDSLKNLWTLYLDFIDVFLILNFIGLCSSIYGRIFGGDTSNYEYYTVEDTYTVNDSTGEVTNHRLNQRKTTRKRVN